MTTLPDPRARTSVAAVRTSTGPLSPSAVDLHYRSVDSSPEAYALNRPASVTNGALVVFLALSALVMLVMTGVVNSGGLERSRDLVYSANPSQHASIPVRLFMYVFFAVVAVSLATNWLRRLLVSAELVGGLLLVSVLVDLTAVVARDGLGLNVSVLGQQTMSVLFGLALFPAVIMRNAHLPTPVALHPGGRIRWHAWLRLALPLLLGFVVAAFVEQAAPGFVAWMRIYGLLGGVGPGVFLVSQVFAFVTALIGLVIIGRSRRQQFAPRVAVLVPAHNEAHDIELTILALDRAAARYAGEVHLYVVDNASSDTTAKVARKAIDECSTLTGTVLHCKRPGKAIALNYGLRRIPEEFVVRIDADTVVGERCLQIAMRHLADPGVGAVGGLPLPTAVETFFDRVRTVEVLVRHGFFQISLMGYDGITGQPGMFVAYRRAAIDAVGLIVQGMNGEDTDICLRFASAGYRMLADPKVEYRSEVPQSWAHMREQRVRWFRSIYHIAGHNRHAIFNRHSMAGAIVLPLQLLNAAHRAMLTPLILYSVLVLTVFRGTFPGLTPGPVVAMVLGLPMLVAIGVCLGLGRPRAVLYVPEYLFFRLVRSYFTLSAVLSLVYPPLHLGRSPRADEHAPEPQVGA